MLLLHPVISHLQWDMLDLVFVLDLKNCPSFTNCCCLSWKCFNLGDAFYFLFLFFLFLFSDTWEVQCFCFHTRGGKSTRRRVSLQDSVMIRDDMLCRVIFLFCLCHLKWLLCLLIHYYYCFFFLFVFLVCSSSYIFSISCPLLKHEAIAFLSQMSYRLAFLSF